MLLNRGDRAAGIVTKYVQLLMKMGIYKDDNGYDMWVFAVSIQELVDEYL